MGIGSIHYKADDIFKHFTNLADEKKLPSFEELEGHAKAVWRNFCSHRAAERALDPVGDPGNEDEHPKVTEWKNAVPLATRVWPASISSTAAKVGVCVRQLSPTRADFGTSD